MKAAKLSGHVVKELFAALLAFGPGLFAWHARLLEDFRIGSALLFGAALYGGLQRYFPTRGGLALRRLAARHCVHFLGAVILLAHASAALWGYAYRELLTENETAYNAAQFRGGMFVILIFWSPPLEGGGRHLQPAVRRAAGRAGIGIQLKSGGMSCRLRQMTRAR